MQLRTTQYHTIPWTTTQYHAILQSIQYSRVQAKLTKYAIVLRMPFWLLRSSSSLLHLWYLILKSVLHHAFRRPKIDAVSSYFTCPQRDIALHQIQGAYIKQFPFIVCFHNIQGGWTPTVGGLKLAVRITVNHWFTNRKMVWERFSSNLNPVCQSSPWFAWIFVIYLQTANYSKQIGIP